LLFPPKEKAKYFFPHGWTRRANQCPASLLAMTGGITDCLVIASEAKQSRRYSGSLRRGAPRDDAEVERVDSDNPHPAHRSLALTTCHPPHAVAGEGSRGGPDLIPPPASVASGGEGRPKAGVGGVSAKRPSSSANADDPASQRRLFEIDKSCSTGYPASAGYDRGCAGYHRGRGAATGGARLNFHLLPPPRNPVAST